MQKKKHKNTAPEILSGEMYGHAIDWWALGVIACRMMTNKVSGLFFSSSSSLLILNIYLSFIKMFCLFFLVNLSLIETSLLFYSLSLLTILLDNL